MVRIINGSFWENYDTYEAIIRRCFVSLYYKKFPNFSSERYDNVEASYNHLLIELNRLRIFDRFDVTKPDISTTSIDKKLEQYLFKWTESILYKEYYDRKKRTIRFRRVDSIDDVHRDIYKSNKNNQEIFADESPLLDVNLLSEKDKKEVNALEEKTNRVYKKYPTIRDIPTMSSEKYESPSDGVEENEVMNLILSVCNNDFERKIIELKKDQLSNCEISKALNCPSYYVNSTLNKISKRYHSKIKSNVVTA